MSDRADNPSERAPIARLAELKLIQYISDALRAGQRAILVTGRGPVSVRVPEAALAACASASARTLHIGPPLPEPAELQEMIGAAIDIVGSRALDPLAMAARLLFADQRQTVILAIDDAHTLSHRSLSYLTLMTELLSPDAPVLQIVLAARPSLLDTLAQPEFESFRNRLLQPGFETFRLFSGGVAKGALSDEEADEAPLDPGDGADSREVVGLAQIQHIDSVTVSQRRHGVARLAGYAAAGFVAMSGLAAISFIAFPVLTGGPAHPPIPLQASAAPQSAPPPLDLPQLGDGNRAASSPDAAAPARPGAPDQAIGTVRSAQAGPLTVLSRERAGEPDNGDRAAVTPDSATPAAPVASLAQDADATQSAPTAPPAVLSRERAGEPGNGDRAAVTRDSATPAAPVAPLAQDADVAQSAPTGPPAAVSTERAGEAGSGDRAAVTPEAAAPTAPVATPAQDADAKQLAAPTSPSFSAERTGATGNGDGVALSAKAAAPTPPNANPDQNVGGDPAAILVRAAQTAPDGPTALVLVGRPALAPVRVALDVARGAKTTTEAAPAAGPSAVSEGAPSAPDEICKRDEERLERLRSSPSSEEAERFNTELSCEKLRPQLLRLMESLGYAPASVAQNPSARGMSALGLKPASDCVSEQDRLNRIRAQPSADMAEQFWRDLQCERLRPQVRLLLESINVAADPPAACQREAEELNRIRTNPNRREAESFARDVTCDALKPQAARLLESLAE